jgi:flagellar motor switch protein FliG
MSTMLATREEKLPQLNGRQKVAVLCITLGPEASGHITRNLSPREVEQISFEIAKMPAIPGPTADAVLMEWLETSRAAEELEEGGVELARQILEQAFGGERADQILKRIQDQIEGSAGLTRLRNADPQQLGNMMRGEHPQTIALVLAHLEATQTATVLKHLGGDLGSEVILRMAKMERVSPEMLQMIERTLSSEPDLNMAEGMRASGGPAAVAEVLNLLPPTLEKEMMETMELRDLELCEQIKALMFVFEDLLSLDDRSVQRVLREVDAKELALALKAASDELKGKIMGAMSQRAVAALKEEIEFLGPVRLRDVETAQAKIVAQVRSLEEQGEIVISAGGDDQVIN